MRTERLVIVNPASGSGRTKGRWRALADQLATMDVVAQVELTQGPNDATRIAREYVQEGGRELVVFGGDGTIGETVAGLVNDDATAAIASGITLSVVHQGTGGDLVRGLGIPRDAAEALEVVAHGDTRDVDLGVATFRDPTTETMHTRAFVSTSNVGMGADVVAQVTGRLKKLGNSGAFAIASVNAIRRVKPKHFTVTRGGSSEQIDALEVMIGNNRYMGGGMIAAPEAIIDDGELDMVWVKPAGKIRLVRTFPKIYKGTHLSDPIVDWFRAPAFSIDEPETPQGVVLDGELVGRTPVSYRVIPRAIRVRVPRVT